MSLISLIYSDRHDPEKQVPGSMHWHDGVRVLKGFQGDYQSLVHIEVRRLSPDQ